MLWFGIGLGCVLGVEGTIVIDEPVDRVILDVSKGDLLVRGEPGDPRLEIDFGGIGGSELVPEVQDGVLHLVYRCGGPGLCGGDLVLSVSPEIPLEIHLGGGRLEIEDMIASVDADLDGGEVSILRHGAGPVTVMSGGDRVELDFVAPPSDVDVRLGRGPIHLVVPAGDYTLDLSAILGLVTVDPAVVDVPGNVRNLTAHAASGNVEVLARP